MKPDRSRARLLITAAVTTAVLCTAALTGCAGQATDMTAASPVTWSAATPAVPPPELPGEPAASVPAPASPPPVIPLPVMPLPVVSAAPSSATDSPTLAAVATVMPASRPVRLQIPAIDVDSGLLDLGLQDDGTIEVPPDAESAGWYTGAPTPGELGPAVIVAHVDWGGELGVFFDLRDLREGDEIMVTREDGTVATFRATSVEQFEKAQFPTEAVYGNIDHAGLRLITCGGEFDPQARSYLDNIVVFADLQP